MNIEMALTQKSLPAAPCWPSPTPKLAFEAGNMAYKESIALIRSWDPVVSIRRLLLVWPGLWVVGAAHADIKSIVSVEF